MLNNGFGDHRHTVEQKNQWETQDRDDSIEFQTSPSLTAWQLSKRCLMLNIMPKRTGQETLASASGMYDSSDWVPAISRTSEGLLVPV
uniref:Uncharacterized protein n=1 Tax=Romanomermis culicivorax TaxID=13658 RepID=A0A915HGZ8_ROMCU